MADEYLVTVYHENWVEHKISPYLVKPSVQGAIDQGLSVRVYETPSIFVRNVPAEYTLRGEK